MKLNDKKLNEIYKKTISNIDFNKKQIQDQHNRYPTYEIIRLDSVLNRIINNITVYDADNYTMPAFKALIVNY